MKVRHGSWPTQARIQILIDLLNHHVELHSTLDDSPS